MVLHYEKKKVKTKHKRLANAYRGFIRWVSRGFIVCGFILFSCHELLESGIRWKER